MSTATLPPCRSHCTQGPSPPRPTPRRCGEGDCEGVRVCRCWWGEKPSPAPLPCVAERVAARLRWFMAAVAAAAAAAAAAVVVVALLLLLFVRHRSRGASPEEPLTPEEEESVDNLRGTPPPTSDSLSPLDGHRDPLPRPLRPAPLPGWWGAAPRLVVSGEWKPLVAGWWW
ncbi:hypothetical protein E2C01_055752 [Portunus trituberculatus]|uniref:Uncharacterized protein n=1 Tax=Portunus trituberculatus TaxID=210409 RepID=A0A5B7GWT6_PORTR|nr:hypothetical protein [Portunus trituberculatus]